MRFLILIATFLIVLVFSKSVKKAGTSSEELSNLQIQVNAPDGGGFVHSALPISARALGARTHGGHAHPTIDDDVIVPYNDPNFE